ncbi:hypothetical protein MRB53_024168 [Persea americana]|uniref:Uncharacterized protein n=1 Tax=Persea americana TaxID=3435 RepID=A0ACC2LC61_PERAE|nr:hypothetical protein MRB53_024168 [Persea americana]
MAKLSKAQRFLKKIGLGKEDYYFWKQIGKSLLCTYALYGAAMWWQENSPLGWWNFKYIPKEEKDTVIYERVNYPYPGDKEAMDAFIASGGLRGTAIGPQGFFDPREDSENYHKEWQKKRYEQEAKKLWFRMKNEVISELQEKGFDNE